MPVNDPFFFSFAQFLAAPRTGKLLDALRRLPERPLTPDELAAQVKVDEATAQLKRFGLTSLLSHPEEGRYLRGRLRRVWDRYQQAIREQYTLQKALQTDQQRWVYDEAVKAGVIVPPQIVVDPRGDLEKEEEKERRAKARELQKQQTQQPAMPKLESARSIVENEMEIVPDAVEDAALDYVENAVGRFYFRDHWKLHRNPGKLAEWLAEQGYSVDTDLVLRELDRLAAEPAWNS